KWMNLEILQKKKNIILIEDTCESLGSKYNNKSLGTFGDFGTLAKKLMLFNKNKHKKNINDKINSSFKKLSRFDYHLNMKKYEKIIKKYIYIKVDKNKND
ncbi:DegT/DnrJ/EryC1/StrS family aminotransferase, partial [Pelagibacterales bacterium SAG-MED07]|nr:DegT/DnrJ/EryC1/StrS family aminotransferase [Pelagibacterales bacterium SAG-MED07]